MPSASQVTADPALEGRLFWDRYKASIIATGAVIVLAGLSYVGYLLYTARSAAHAAALLASAHTAQDYQRLIDRYPASEPAASAYLLLAAEQRAERKYTEANATLHKFVDQFPKHPL